MAMPMLAMLALVVSACAADAPEAGSHGLDHPLVAILPGTPRLAWSAAKSGWMEIQFVVSGVVPGFQYRVMLEAIAEGSEGRYHYVGGNALQRWELVWPDTEEHERLAMVRFLISPGEAGVITWSDAELRQFYHFDSGLGGHPDSAYRFRIHIFDAHPGLTEEDALVARTDLLLRLDGEPSQWAREHVQDGNTGMSALRNKRSSWAANESFWKVWIREAYRSVAEAALLLNLPGLAHQLGTSRGAPGGGGPWEAECSKIWEIPIAVMSLPGSDARRENTRRVLEGIGFANIIFPHVVAWSDVTEQQMVSDDVLAASFFSRLQTKGFADTDNIGQKRYAANALSHIQRIQQAAAANQSVIIVEDDLMPSGSLGATREHICQTLSDLPPTADMVYLEYCFESCANVWYDRRYPRLARAFEPSCAAAIYFTAKGARRITDLCLPVFNSIDKMYPHLIRKGWVEAYVMVGPAFFQDHAFGSHLQRASSHWLPHHPAHKEKCHQPSTAAPACNDLYWDPEFQHIDLRQMGVIFYGAEAPAALAALEANPVCRATPGASSPLGDQTSTTYIWLKYPVFRAWVDDLSGLPWGAVGGQHVSYYVRGRGSGLEIKPGQVNIHWQREVTLLKMNGKIYEFFKESQQLLELQLVGQWEPSSECGAILRFKADAECLHASEYEPCEIKSILHNEQGAVVGEEKFKVFLVHWMHFHCTPGKASCDKPSEPPNGDRSVALHRWRATRRETGTEAMSGFLFQVLDTDRDGKLSSAEYNSGLDTIDSDKDGFITRKEFTRKEFGGAHGGREGAGN